MTPAEVVKVCASFFPTINKNQFLYLPKCSRQPKTSGLSREYSKKLSTVDNLCQTSLLISFLNIRQVLCLRICQGQCVFFNGSRSAQACNFKPSRLFNLQNSCFHINFQKFVGSFSCFIIVTLLTYISYSFLSIKNIALKSPIPYGETVLYCTVVQKTRQICVPVHYRAQRQ